MPVEWNADEAIEQAEYARGRTSYGWPTASASHLNARSLWSTSSSPGAYWRRSDMMRR